MKDPATLVWAEIIVAKALNGEDTTPVLELIARSGIDAEELRNTVTSILNSVHEKIATTPAEGLDAIDDLAKNA